MRRAVLERLLGSAVICPEKGCWLWSKSTRPNGYGQTSFREEGRYIPNIAVHRLMAHLALGLDLDSGMLALHRCDVRRCFRPDHLFIGTAADNTADMIQKGRAKIVHRGESSGMAKLSEDEVREIRKRSAAGQGMRSLGRAFGVSHESIRDVVRRRTWTHV